MENNDIALELTRALNKAKTDLGLNDILQSRGILKDESVKVEFKYGDKSDCVAKISQRQVEIFIPSR